MAFVKNKVLYVVAGNQHSPFHTINEEIFLTADRNNLFSFDDYHLAITSPSSIRVTRVFLLNSDETIKEDLSEFLISGNIDMTQASGCQKSGNMSLWNDSKRFSPNVMNNLIWEGTKLRIDTGIYSNGYVFWQKQGVFVVHNPNDETETNSVSFTIYDKFSLLDGKVSGKRDSEFKIPVGTKVKDAICLCLKPDDDISYDAKSVIFPAKYIEQTTPYTIVKDPNCTMGDIVVELAKMLSCDACYNESGNLVVHSDGDAVDYNTIPVQWVYRNEDALTSRPTIAYNFDNIAKKVTVVGAIENGKQYRGVFINENPVTKHYTQKMMYISDNNIIGDDLCLDRAKYEYKKSCRLNIQLSFASIYIPHLLPNSIVMWSNEEYGYKHEKFIINSINVDLMNSTVANMSLTYLEGLKI